MRNSMRWVCAALVSALSLELGGCGKAGSEQPAPTGGASGVAGSEGGGAGQLAASAGSVGEAGSAGAVGNAGNAGQGGMSPGAAGSDSVSVAGEGGACAGGDCGPGTPAVCGDGSKEGAETCDDGNNVPLDGCSGNCQAEPDCTAPGCASRCGDGLVSGEQCDDGNLKNGDGCSAKCQIEPGFTCTEPAQCAASNDPCVLRVPVIYHDFNAGMPADFESACGKVARSAATLGMVESALNSQGLPVYAANAPPSTSTCVTSAATFSQWFADGPNSTSIADTISLFDDGNGGWVNRWGANGEQWLGFKDIADGKLGVTGETYVANDYTTCAAAGCVPCSYATRASPYGCTGAIMESFDGNPLFFPLDDNPKARVEARSFGEISPAYGYNFVRDTDILALVPAPVPHDFSFTSHVVFWFKYDAAKTAKLSFTGDDDVWVFINDMLAIDLGGLHTPVSGSVTVSSATAGKFGLVDGNVYRVSVFHAERARNGSSFRLALSGLYTAPSVCVRGTP